MRRQFNIKLNKEEFKSWLGLDTLKAPTIDYSRIKSDVLSDIVIQQGAPGIQGERGRDGSPDDGADIIKKINSVPYKGPKIHVSQIDGLGGVVAMGGGGANATLANIWGPVQTFSVAPIFSTMTAGSILFAGTAGVLSQDNNNFYFDDTNDKFYLGSNNTSTYKATPTMTSNSTPSPFVTAASTEANGSNAAFAAFDENLTTKWTTNTDVNEWLSIDFSQIETINAYSITGPIAGQETFAPKSWTFQGSNDNSTWTTLNTQTNAAVWTALEVRSFTLSNPARYRYYRIFISTSYGAGRISITEFKLFYYTTISLKRNATDSYIDSDSTRIKLSTVSTTDGTAKLLLTDKRGIMTGAILSTDSTQLVLEQTGDTFGGTQLILQNRNGANGAIFKNLALDLVDFAFNPNSGVQSNIRFEHRSAALVSSLNASGEFQFVDQATGSATKVFIIGLAVTALSSGKLLFNDGVNISLQTTTGTKIGTATNEKLGFWNATPVVQPTVTGSKGANAALTSLLTQLATMGLIVDSST